MPSSELRAASFRPLLPQCQTCCMPKHVPKLGLGSHHIQIGSRQSWGLVGCCPDSSKEAACCTSAGQKMNFVLTVFILSFMAVAGPKFTS